MRNKKIIALVSAFCSVFCCVPAYALDMDLSYSYKTESKDEFVIVGNDIGAIIKKEGKTAILVTHDLSEAISLGTQIIVLSRRPASVSTTIPIRFSETLSALERRNSPEFKDCFNKIWKELNKYE